MALKLHLFGMPAEPTFKKSKNVKQADTRLAGSRASWRGACCEYTFFACIKGLFENEATFVEAASLFSRQLDLVFANNFNFATLLKSQLLSALLA